MRNSQDLITIAKIQSKQVNIIHLFIIVSNIIFQPLAYLIELNSAVGGLEFMQKNINFFDGNSIFVIILRDQIKSADFFPENKSNISQDTSRPNVLQATDPNIIKFVKSPIMERLTNSVFLVLRNNTRVDIWGQVLFQQQDNKWMLICSHHKDSFHRGERLSVLHLGTYENHKFWGGENIPLLDLISKFAMASFFFRMLKAMWTSFQKSCKGLTRKSSTCLHFTIPPR